jgi:hypothetical protein
MCLNRQKGTSEKFLQNDDIQSRMCIRQNIRSSRARGFLSVLYRARICKLFKEPRNRFPAWRAGTITLFVAPARHATQAGGIESSESIPGLLKRLQIRAQYGFCRDVKTPLIFSFYTTFKFDLYAKRQRPGEIRQDKLSTVQYLYIFITSIQKTN